MFTNDEVTIINRGQVVCPACKQASDACFARGLFKCPKCKAEATCGFCKGTSDAQNPCEVCKVGVPKP